MAGNLVNRFAVFRFMAGRIAAPRTNAPRTRSDRNRHPEQIHTQPDYVQLLNTAKRFGYHSPAPRLPGTFQRISPGQIKPAAHIPRMTQHTAQQNPIQEANQPTITAKTSPKKPKVKRLRAEAYKDTFI